MPTHSTHRRVRAPRSKTTIELSPAIAAKLRDFRFSVRRMNTYLHDTLLTPETRRASFRAALQRVQAEAAVLYSAFVYEDDYGTECKS